MQLSWRVKQRAVQGAREGLIRVLGVRHEVFVARSLGPDRLLRLERLQQSRLLRRALLLQYLVEVDDLLVVDRPAQGARLDEVAEVGRLRQLVYKGVRAVRVLVSPELVVVEEILRLGVVIDGLTCAHPGVLQVLLVVFHDA